jgi:hypothetical protein
LKRYFNILILTFVGIFISGCAQTNAQQMVNLTETSLKERQLQTRNYDTTQEDKILTSSVATLQDLGFNIDEINVDLGIVTCSKTRDAREIGQQVGLVLLAVLSGNGDVMDSADHTQIIRATVVTTPKTKLKKETSVRLTIMRVIKNHKGNVLNVETIKDQTIYKQFFDKVSKSVFLEDNNV